MNPQPPVMPAPSVVQAWEWQNHPAMPGWQYTMRPIPSDFVAVVNPPRPDAATPPVLPPDHWWNRFKDPLQYNLEQADTTNVYNIARDIVNAVEGWPPYGGPGTPDRLTIAIGGPTGCGKTFIADILEGLKRGRGPTENAVKLACDIMKRRGGASIVEISELTSTGEGKALLPVEIRITNHTDARVEFGPIKADLLERAWGIIANAKGWDVRHGEDFTWRDAATEWRDDYFASIRKEAAASFADKVKEDKEPGPLLQLVFMDGAQPWDSSIDTIDQDRLSEETIAVLHKAGVLAVGPFNINFITVPRRLGPEFAQEIREAVLGDSTLRLHYLLTGAGLIPPWDGPKPEA